MAGSDKKNLHKNNAADAHEIRSLSFFDAQLDELQPLYDRVLNMEDLDNPEKLAAYDQFLGALEGVAGALVANDPANMEQSLAYMTRRLNMPLDIFPDRGAQFTHLKAMQIKDLLDRADLYNERNARADLEARGNLNPSAEDVSQHCLETRIRMYEKAENFYERFSKTSFSASLARQLEIESGYNKDHMDSMVESAKLQLEQLGINPAYLAYEQNQITTKKEDMSAVKAAVKDAEAVPSSSYSIPKI